LTQPVAQGKDNSTPLKPYTGINQTSWIGRGRAAVKGKGKAGSRKVAAGGGI
jgi:hypothetical protein